MESVSDDSGLSDGGTSPTGYPGSDRHRRRSLPQPRPHKIETRDPSTLHLFHSTQTQSSWYVLNTGSLNAWPVTKLTMQQLGIAIVEANKAKGLSGGSEHSSKSVEQRLSKFKVKRADKSKAKSPPIGQVIISDDGSAGSSWGSASCSEPPTTQGTPKTQKSTLTSEASSTGWSPSKKSRGQFDDLLESFPADL